VQRSPTT